jgi:hypothetical protein
VFIVLRLATTLVGVIFFAGTGSLFARLSLAEPRPDPIAWTYRAPPECPPAETFEDEFRARTSRAELVAGVTDAPRRFLVTVSTEPSRAVGRIEIQGTTGTVSTREVVGQTCQGVVSALALIAALAVDPLAADSPRPPARSADGPSPAPVRDGGSDAGVRPTARAVLAAGVDGGAVFGLFPKAAPRVSLFAEAQIEGWALAPAARLSFSAATSSSVAAPPGSATFRWWAAALDGCPLEVRFVEAVRVAPCAFAELGVLAGTGAGVAMPHVESRRWIAVGGSAKLTWLVLGSFLLEAQGRLAAPLARDTFVLAAPERVVVHAVPAVLGSVELGAGVRWP